MGADPRAALPAGVRRRTPAGRGGRRADRQAAERRPGRAALPPAHLTAAASADSLPPPDPWARRVRPRPQERSRSRAVASDDDAEQIEVEAPLARED